MAFLAPILVGIGAAVTGGALSGIAAGVVGAISVISTVAGIASAVTGMLRGTGANGGLNGLTDSFSSPTYSFGQLVTQTNSSYVVPIVYGEVKIAGNILYQEGSTTLRRLTSFSLGEIQGFSDIRLNDLEISTINGATYDTYTGNGTQLIDSRVPGATQAEKASVVGGLRYEAYIATTVTANKQISSDFNITTLCKGKKLNVYDEKIGLQDGNGVLLAEDGSTLRLEEGNYTFKYSNNPSYCLLDYLTSYEGLGMSMSDIDIPSFIETARFCDSLVNDQPRFTLNLVIDQTKSALAWINEICKASQSIFGKRGDKWFLIADKAEDTSSVMTFTKDHITDFSSWFVSMDDTYDVVNVNYKDKDYQWTFVQARAEADVYLRNDYPLVKTFDILGVTNFAQGSRLAWFYLNQSYLTPLFISFKTSKKGLNLTVGDIIAVDDYIFGFANKFYRILSIEESQNNQIQLSCREYNASLYGDTQGSVAPTLNFLQNNYDAIFTEDFSGLLLIEASTEDHIILEY